MQLHDNIPNTDTIRDTEGPSHFFYKLLSDSWNCHGLLKLLLDLGVQSNFGLADVISCLSEGFGKSESNHLGHLYTPKEKYCIFLFLRASETAIFVSNFA